MKKYIYISVLCSLCLLSACSDSWTELESEGSLTNENFYKTNEDNIQAVASIYDCIQWVNAQDWSSLYHTKTILSDEARAGGENDGDQPEYHEFDDWKFTPGNTKINDLWTRLYYGVYRANVVIANVGEAPNSDAVRAEAYALRAYLYFELVNLFAEVPLVLKELAPSEYNVFANTEDEIYAQIEADLKLAIENLPVKSKQEGKWRIAKGFANALMGKVLIFQEKYSDAIPYLEAVSGYSLYPDYADILKIPSEYGVESLFEIGWDNTAGWNWGNYNTWGKGREQENNIHWILCGPREGFFSAYDDENPIAIGYFKGWGALVPTKKIYELYNDDDPRRKLTVLSEEELNKPEYNITLKNDKGSFQHEGEGVLRLKYGTWASEGGQGDGDEPGLNMGTNLRIMRFAEVLLLKAEAYVKAGRAGDAIPLIQQLHDRAGYNDVVSSVDMNVIKYERNAELAYEGHRFYDMVRWGKAEELISARTGVTYAEKYTKLPVPQAELDKNPNLVQNSYWK